MKSSSGKFYDLFYIWSKNCTLICVKRKIFTHFGINVKIIYFLKLVNFKLDLTITRYYNIYYYKGSKFYAKYLGFTIWRFTISKYYCIIKIKQFNYLILVIFIYFFDNNLDLYFKYIYKKNLNFFSSGYLIKISQITLNFIWNFWKKKFLSVISTIQTNGREFTQWKLVQKFVSLNNLCMNYTFFF